jgi:hypothetical protein
MRLATAPGRSARPAPPGNNDPCGERRTIPEGMPRLPREALMMRLQTGGSEVRRKAGTRERQARARARNPTWSAARRASPSLGTQDVSTQIELRSSVCAYRSRPRASCGAQRTQGGLSLGPVDRWGVRTPVMACRSGCVACIQAPPALRPPLAKGAAKCEGRSE